MNNPMSIEGTVPARKEHTMGVGPSSINLSRCESGAINTFNKIDQGRPFQCIRHPEKGTAMVDDCTNYTRRLCAECSTGRIIRSRAGVAERPFTIHKEDDVAKTKPKMIVCPECGRKMEEKARGVCARCYKYVASGQSVPPLPPELQPKKAATKAQPKPAPKPETTEQIGPLDDFPGTIQTDREVIGILDQAVAGAEGHDNRPKSGLVLDFSGFPGADELVEWLHDTAVDQMREPEAQAFYLLRQAQRITGTLARSRDRFHKECRCSA